MRKVDLEKDDRRLEAVVNSLPTSVDCHRCLCYPSPNSDLEGNVRSPNQLRIERIAKERPSQTR